MQSTQSNTIDTFNRDLSRGEQIEHKVLSVIQKTYPKAYKIEGYFKGYDLFVPEISKSIEVKSDEKSKYTGNIVVEIEFNGKPSALSTTEADYWVWWDGYSLTWFTVDLINRCIEETSPPLCKFVGKGDSKQKKAYLIKKEVLYRYSLSNNNKV
jgi:hypothetical protein